MYRNPKLHDIRLLPSQRDLTLRSSNLIWIFRALSQDGSAFLDLAWARGLLNEICDPVIGLKRHHRRVSASCCWRGSLGRSGATGLWRRHWCGHQWLLQEDSRSTITAGRVQFFSVLRISVVACPRRRATTAATNTVIARFSRAILILICS
jgi:hypothetical protein